MVLLEIKKPTRDPSKNTYRPGRNYKDCLHIHLKIKRPLYLRTDRLIWLPIRRTDCIYIHKCVCDFVTTVRHTGQQYKNRLHMNMSAYIYAHTGMVSQECWQSKNTSIESSTLSYGGP